MDFKKIPEHFPEVQLALIEPGYCYCNTHLGSAKDIYTFMRNVLRERSTECVYVVTLNNVLSPINYSLIGRGNTTESAFNISDIVKVCLLSNASYCVVVHNHLTSGKPQPSRTDDNTAQGLIHILSSMQITLCDFVITSPDSFYSYLAEERAPFDNKSHIYDKHMSFPDSPYVTMAKKVNLCYARKLSNVEIDEYGEPLTLPFD